MEEERKSLKVTTRRRRIRACRDFHPPTMRPPTHKMSMTTVKLLFDVMKGIKKSRKLEVRRVLTR
jgi:hypothetical protein